MKKLAITAAGFALATAFVSTSAFATSPGQLATGENQYLVRNVTRNIPADSYAESVDATCGDTVKYSIQISNTQYGTLKDVTVKAPLSGNVSVTGVNETGQTVAVNGTVDVKLDKGTLRYVNGSAVLRAEDNSNIRTLADTVTTTGVNTGDLNGSTDRFVQFQAKVECETPATPVTPETPKELPSTGAGSMILPALAVAAIGAAAAYAVSARRSFDV